MGLNLKKKIKHVDWLEINKYKLAGTTYRFPISEPSVLWRKIRDSTLYRTIKDEKRTDDDADVDVNVNVHAK